MKAVIYKTLAVIVTLSVATIAVAQGPGHGKGPGYGRRLGEPGHRHQGRDARHEEDHKVFQFLLMNHKQITRNVQELPNGVETLTESDNPQVAGKIKEHVRWMEARIHESRPIRMRDPLFRELFQHADKIEIERKETEKGVRVIETSNDPYVAKLIKAHAETVSGFVARGFTEAMKNHAVPGKNQPIGEAGTPAVKGYGQIFKLPTAAHQPRDGSRICVDVTRGGDPEQLNPGIEKVAKYVNLYQGSGRKLDVSIAVVLHGNATLAVLNSDAYAERFGTDANPNFDCLHKLHEAGVEIFVCGQTLISNGAKLEDVMVFIDPAFSAVTAIVNLQSDGYAYVPLGG